MSSAVASARKPAATGTPLALVSAATGAHKRPSPGVGASFAGPWETPAVLYGLAWRVALSVDAIQLCSTAG